MASMPSGTSVSGVTSAPPAIIARTPMRAPSSTVLPLPTRASSPSQAAWMVQLWPTVAPRPISTPARAVTCTTEQSCTLAPARTTIGFRSPRSTALYQTEARSSIVTSPMRTAVGAMKAVGCTFGRLPSKLKSGMGSILAVCSTLSFILYDASHRRRRHRRAALSLHAGADSRARRVCRRAPAWVLRGQRHRGPPPLDRSRALHAEGGGGRAKRAVLRGRAGAGGIGRTRDAGARGLGAGGSGLHRPHDVHGTAHAEPRRPSGRPPRLPRRGPARARGRHRLRLRDGRAAAGVESSAGFPPSPRARDRRRDLLGGVFPRRPARERRRPRHLRRRRGRRGARRRRRAWARDHRAPHPVQLRAPSRDGVRVSGRSAARRALQGGPADRGVDDGSDGARAHGVTGPQARRRRALGAALRGPPRAGPRARPARPHRRPDGARARGPARARQHLLGDHPLRPRAPAAPRASRARPVGPHDRPRPRLRGRRRAAPLVMRRAEGAREYLDGRVPPADLAATLADLDRLNAWFGGHALSLARVRRVAAHVPRDRTLRIVDVGGGDGAFARRVVRWARRAGRRVRVLVVDDDAETARLAIGACAAYPDIAVLRADATALPLAASAADVVHAGLTLHHLEPDAAVPALREMRRACRGRVVVNDLARTPLALGLVWLATRLLPVHPMSRHDGPLSVRRAYAPSELGDLFGAAGVTRATVTHYPWLARLVVEAT